MQQRCLKYNYPPLHHRIVIQKGGQMLNCPEAAVIIIIALLWEQRAIVKVGGGQWKRTG